jgi:bacterioferritin-associated ferredoxin
MSENHSHRYLESTIVYVCICNAVTERQLRDAIESGAGTLAELQMDLGVAAGCGCCAGTIEAHLAERRCEGARAGAVGSGRAPESLAPAALVLAGAAANLPLVAAD